MHDLGEMTRYQFYEWTKTYIASPPDVHRVDEKNLREHAILNVNGVIMTTNYKEGGMFLPPNDRRHFVMYSPLTEDDFAEVGYWKKLWDWYYKEGGFQHVAAYLRGVDLSGFDPKAPPPKTKAFFDIVNSNRGQEEGEMADVFDLMKNPEVVTLDDIRHNSGSFPELSNWLAETRNRRVVPYRLKTVGYVPVYNPDAKDGLFKVRGRRVSIYAKEPLSVVDQLKAVTKYLADQEGKKPKPWEK